MFQRVLVWGIAASVATIASAQLTVTATVSGGGVDFWCSGAQSSMHIPAGSDVSGGIPFQALGFPVLTVSHQAQDSHVELNASAPAFSFCLWESHASIDLTYRSVVPMRVDIALSAVAFQTGTTNSLPPTGSAQATLLGGGPLTNVLVDATGIVIRLTGLAQSNQSFGATESWSFDIDSRVTPSDTSTAYGTPCGTDFSATPTTFGYQLTVSDPEQLQFGVLFIGDGALQFPLPWGCDLLCDYFVALPLVPDPTGTTIVDGVLVPPGLFTMQAATYGFDAGSQPVIHMSQGLEFQS